MIVRFKPIPRSCVSLLAGAVMAICFFTISNLPALRGSSLNSFVPLFLLAAVAYGVAVFWLDRGPLSLPTIWAFAVLFRLTLLMVTPPTLSDDVYRYLWDGRLVNAGVSPYAFTVDSPLLEQFDSPQRLMVNNAWMASPYLPVAQVYFAVVYRLAPDNPTAFQVAGLLFDLLTGWLVVDLLRRLDLPRHWALIYLWNPLVIVEFAHGAHMDALLLCLMMTSLWGLAAVRKPPNAARLAHSLFPTLSVAALAAATLTKGIPALLLPVVAWRWGWRRTLLYVALIVAVLLPFGLRSGWGLIGPRDGEGLFGALRIYGARWNYNGGLYHWLEVALSGYHTPGAVPLEIVGETPIRTAKLMMAAALGLTLVAIAWKSRNCKDNLLLLRFAILPLAAYLLLTTTVHPWYVTVVIPLLPFFVPKNGGAIGHHRFVWPWLYFSAAVALSYFTYLDPANLREYAWVRLIEYLPLYLLLVWSLWPASAAAGGSDAD